MESGSKPKIEVSRCLTILILICQSREKSQNGDSKKRRKGKQKYVKNLIARNTIVKQTSESHRQKRSADPKDRELFSNQILTL